MGKWWNCFTAISFCHILQYCCSWLQCNLHQFLKAIMMAHHFQVMQLTVALYVTCHFCWWNSAASLHQINPRISNTGNTFEEEIFYAMLAAVQQAGGSKSSIIPSNSAFILHQTEDFRATSKWSCNKIYTDPESVSSRVAAVVTRGLSTQCQTTIIIIVCSFM